MRPPAHPRPADAAGRCGTYDLRHASGLHLPARVERQIERDALVHRLEVLDARLAELAEERRAIVDELATLRQVLYPPVPWCHGRRPPPLDHAPLPPAPDGAQPLHGRDLRAACLAILRRHGPQALRELHGLLHRYGYLVGARRPVAALSDAMAYEVEQDRAQRLDRGLYGAAGAPPRRGRGRPGPPLGGQPEPWIDQRPTPLDPDLDEDPTTWNPAPPSIPPP